MAERRLPSNLQHFNKLLTEYSKREDGMPVVRARHAIGGVRVLHCAALVAFWPDQVRARLCWWKPLRFRNRDRCLTV
jgi:hypothetical protein